MADSHHSLTTPDLVALSFLLDAPMHGYQLNQELERCDVRDWAGISRPQVYYSLRKLEKQGLIEPVLGAPARGPERQTYRTTADGQAALADALDREDWATQRPPPPFLTWLALAPHGSRASTKRQVDRRRHFLRDEIDRERRTLAAFREGAAGEVPFSELMVRLSIRLFEAELEWLEEVDRTVGR